MSIPDYFRELEKGKHALPADAQFTNLRHAVRDMHEIAEIAALTGETVINKLVTYPVLRLALLETTAYIETELRIRDEENLPELVQDIYRNHIKPAIKAIRDKDGLNLENQIQRDVSALAKAALVPDAKEDTPYQVIAAEIKKKAVERYASGQYKLNTYVTVEQEVSTPSQPVEVAAELDEWILRAVFDQIYQIVSLERVSQIVSQTINDLVKTKKIPLERMAEFSGDQRHTFVLSGPPACGKGMLIALIEPEAKVSNGVRWDDVVKINTDVHRRIVSHHDITGEEKELSVRLNGDEAVFITERAYSLIRAKINNNRAPHLLIDGAIPGEDRIELATHNHGKMHWSIVTAPVDVAIERAYTRGLESGRFIMTDYMLRAHQIIAIRFFEYLKKYKDRDIEFAIFNTDVPVNQAPVKIIDGSLKEQSAVIFDPTELAIFYGKKNINLQAKDKDELFKSEKEKSSTEYKALLRDAGLAAQSPTPLQRKTSNKRR